MDYIYVYTWGLMTGSFIPYIDRQIEKARADKAPERAVYYSNYEKRWITLDECDTIVQNAVNKWVEQIRKKGRVRE